MNQFTPTKQKKTQMEFEESYGVQAWCDDDECEDDIDFVDDFLWVVINACVSGQTNVRGSDAWNRMNRAIQSTADDGPFVYRLGNLGMTYDLDVVENIVHVEDDMIETDTFGDMLAVLREIYVAHEEEQAVGVLDAFMARASPCIVLKMSLDAVM